jgi:hypothetical protein
LIPKWAKHTLMSSKFPKHAFNTFKVNNEHIHINQTIFIGLGHITLAPNLGNYSQHITKYIIVSILTSLETNKE